MLEFCSNRTKHRVFNLDRQMQLWRKVSVLGEVVKMHIQYVGNTDKKDDAAPSDFMWASPVHVVSNSNFRLFERDPLFHVL